MKYILYSYMQCLIKIKNLLVLPLSTISAINPNVTQGQKQVTKPQKINNRSISQLLDVYTIENEE